MQNVTIYDEDGRFYVSYVPETDARDLGMSGQCTTIFESAETRARFLAARRFMERICPK